MGPPGTITLLAAASGYHSAIETWRQQYEASLRAPQGWLSVAGLFWLEEGPNTIGFVPQNQVVIDFHNGVAHLKGKALQPDTAAHPDVITLGDLTLAVIQRGNRTGIRLRDPNSEARRNFTGLHWFPIDERYQVRARWHAYNPPHRLPITNVLGMTEPEDCPSYAEFELGGKTWRLEPTVEDNTLFFTFKDETARTETYLSGRFLNTPMPHNGEVPIDFNQAHNPPCAFTAFATCPLPPRQNTIGVRIEAGEKRHGKY